jgi:hypothetical protein
MGVALSIKTRLALYSATIEGVISRSPKFSGQYEKSKMKDAHKKATEHYEKMNATACEHD